MIRVCAHDGNADVAESGDVAGGVDAIMDSVLLSKTAQISTKKKCTPILLSTPFLQ